MPVTRLRCVARHADAAAAARQHDADAAAAARQQSEEKRAAAQRALEAKLAALRALGVRKVAPVEVKAESDRVNDAEEEEQQRAGADYKLFYAAYYEKFGEVTRLLAEGANPNGYKSWVRACARAASLPAAPAPRPLPHSPALRRRRTSSQCDETALTTASWAGNTAIVQKLLDAGADRNAKMRGGDTALTLAIRRAHGAVVQALRAADVGEADLDAQAKQGTKRKHEEEDDEDESSASFR